MSAINSFSSSHTLSLFGIAHKPRQVSQPQVAKVEAEPVMRKGTPITTVSAPGESKPEQEMRRLQAMFAAAAERAAGYRAVEDAFEKEHGYRREVDVGLMGTYQAAVSGNYSPASFGSRDEALAFARSQMSAIAGQLSSISFLRTTLTEANFDKMVGLKGEAEALRRREMRQDQMQAAEMRLFIHSAYLAKSLDVSAPQGITDTGRVLGLNATEIRYNGSLLLGMDGRGNVTLFHQDGVATAAEPSPFVSRRQEARESS